MAKRYRVHEALDSQRPELRHDGTDERDELLFNVEFLDGSDDPREAIAAVMERAPATVGTLELDRVGLGEHLAPGWVQVYARYVKPEEKEKDETSPPIVRFSTAGGRQKITQSKETLAVTSIDAGVAPNTFRAIGVTEDDVEGTEVIVPVFEFEETWIKEASDITPAYVRKLIDTTGKVNTAEFRELAAGECLCMGVDGQKRDDGKWELTFKFAGSPNANVTVHPDWAPIAKPGWAYLWVRYRKKEVGTGAHKVLSQVPEYAYVERVYDSADFAELEID